MLPLPSVTAESPVEPALPPTTVPVSLPVLSVTGVSEFEALWSVTTVSVGCEVTETVGLDSSANPVPLKRVTLATVTNVKT